MTDAGADAAASEGPVGEPLPASETPYVAKDYRRFTTPVGNGQCAVLVEKATGAPLAKYWKQGASIADRPNVPDGTAIATFVGGVYPNKSTGNHAAIFVGYGVKNKKPGIWIYDQFVKDGTARIGARFIGFKHGTGYISNDASRFSVIK
jgi:hypothetical protein